ncbi:MAG: PEP-CTERM sorting domain-containing protein [Planctomycetes bacterium]|nr:PEP-CTERM sorting domain-containing protein [Planctomycetota bacterium]
MHCFRKFSLVVAILSSLLSTSSVFAGIETFTIPSVAAQNVDLFGIIHTPLVAVGTVKWTLDVDENGNSINSDSSIDAQFHGILPSAFASLGLAGLPFDLYSLPTGQSVTVTGNGTLVTVDTTFGLAIPAAGTTLYTNVPSEFVTSVSGIPFTSFFATSPDPVGIYMGDNPFGIPPGTLVGDSYGRTVYSTPEPGSLTLFALSLTSLVGIAWLRKRKTKVFE